MASDHTTSQKEIMTSQKNHSLCEKKTMNYDFRVHTLFHKDFSMVLFEDKIIENLMVFSFTLHMVVQHHAVYEIQCDFPCVKPGDRENLL